VVGDVVAPDIGEIEVSLATGRGGNHNASAFMIVKGDEALLEAAAAVDEISGLGSIAEAYLMGTCPGARRLGHATSAQKKTPRREPGRLCLSARDLPS
jgi:hypothetical protein